jgi:hypothetical protein
VPAGLVIFTGTFQIAANRPDLPAGSIPARRVSRVDPVSRCERNRALLKGYGC